MKRLILFTLAVLSASGCLYAQTAKNPFSKLGYHKQVMFTSSKGEFEEFHDKADVVEIGSVYFNTITNKVVGFISEEKEKSKVSSATTAMSVDPLCEKYYWISPYAYCAGNPVRYVDVKGQWIKDATGARVQVTYNDNGSLSFSRNADANTIRMSNAMNLTETGRSMLQYADNSSIGVRMVISSDTKVVTVNGKTSYTNGETIQGNFNNADNYGRVVNGDGTFGIKEATITVNEGTLKESVKTGSGTKLEGLSMEQAIGAVAGHETVHATNKGEINKDIKAENSGIKRTDGEVKPNNVEKKIIDESNQP